MSGRNHLSVIDSPDFVSELLSELSRVGDDNNSTLELLESLGESAERVSVQVVGWLVEDDDVWLQPGTCSQDQLDLLTSGETLDSGVRDDLSLESEQHALGLNLLSGKGSELTGLEGLLEIDLGNELLMGLDDLTSWQPGVVGGHHWSPGLALHTDVVSEQPGNLILVRVLELSSGVDRKNLSLRSLNSEDLVGHGLLILLGDDTRGTVHGLSVLTSLVSPLNVFRWSLVDVVVQVNEGGLRDVCNSQVRVSPDVSRSWDELSGENLDECRLSSSVWSDDGNSRGQRALEGDVRQLWLCGTWVLEGHVVDLDDRLLLGLDSLQETWLWESELLLGGSKLVVRLGGWHLLDELGQVTLVLSELESLVVDDVLDDVVKETGVVGNDHGSDVLLSDKEVLEPFDVLDVEMVGGLVEEENVCLLQHGSGESQLHLPTSGETSDRLVEEFLAESDGGKHVLGILGGHTDISGALGVGGDEVQSSDLSLRLVDVVLDVDGLELISRWESVDLSVGDSPHESRLSGSVWSTESVSRSSDETQVGSVQQNLGTVGKGELAIAQNITLLLLFLVSWRTSTDVGDRLESVLLGDLDGLLLRHHRGQVGDSVLVELHLLEVVVNLSKLTDDGGNEREGLLVSLVGLGNNALQGSQELWHGVLGGDGWVHGSVSLQRLLRSSNDISGLWIGHTLEGLLQVSLEGTHEWSEQTGVLDQLGHVVDNDGGLSLDWSLSRVETTGQERGHDGERWGLHLLDEGSSSESVDSLGNLVWVGDTGDQDRDEFVDVGVGDKGTDFVHGLTSLLLDLRLGVPHSRGDDRDELRHAGGHLRGCDLDKILEEREGGELLWPFRSVLYRRSDDRQSSLDGVRVDLSDDCVGSVGRGILDGDLLVGNSLDREGEKLHEVWLKGSADRWDGDHGGDSLDGLLPDERILLVLQLGLDGGNDLGRTTRNAIRPRSPYDAKKFDSLLLLDRTVDEAGQVVGGSVSVGLTIGDGQFLQ